MLLKTLVATLTISTLALVAPAPSQADDPSEDGPGYQAPVVGECHQLGRDQVYEVTDTTDPVPCSKKHTSEVVAVTELPADTDWEPGSDDLIDAITKHCIPAFRKALGAGVKKIAMSSYAWSWWIPTRAQRKHGATWFRCDVSRWNNGSLGTLPEDFRLRGALTKAERNCITVSRRGYIHSSCAGRHNFRAVKAFIVPGKNARLPSRETFLRFAERHCPGQGWYATWQGTAEWKSGDHSLTCYLPH